MRSSSAKGGPRGRSGSAGSGTDAPASKLRSGSARSSQEGIHQFQLPSSFIAAGTRIRRTRVASSAIATAQPSPSSFIEGTPVRTKTAKTQVMLISVPPRRAEVLDRPLERHSEPVRRLETKPPRPPRCASSSRSAVARLRAHRRSPTAGDAGADPDLERGLVTRRDREPNPEPAGRRLERAPRGEDPGHEPRDPTGARRAERGTGARGCGRGPRRSGRPSGAAPAPPRRRPRSPRRARSTRSRPTQRPSGCGRSSARACPSPTTRSRSTSIASSGSRGPSARPLPRGTRYRATNVSASGWSCPTSSGARPSIVSR